MISSVMAALGGGMYDLTGVIPEVGGYPTRASEGLMAVVDMLHEWLGWVAFGLAIVTAVWHRRLWAVIVVSHNAVMAYEPEAVWRRYGIWSQAFSMAGDRWFYVVSAQQAGWACEALERCASGRAPVAWRDRHIRRNGR